MRRGGESTAFRDKRTKRSREIGRCRLGKLLDGTAGDGKARAGAAGKRYSALRHRPRYRRGIKLGGGEHNIASIADQPISRLLPEKIRCVGSFGGLGEKRDVGGGMIRDRLLAMRRNNIGPRGAEQWPICRRTLQRLSRLVVPSHNRRKPA